MSHNSKDIRSKMISDNLKSCLHEFEFIARLKPKTRELVLSDPALSDERYYKALKEIAQNTIKRNIPLKKKKIPLKCKRHIFGLAYNKCKRHRKHHQIQSGGWIQYILPILLELIDG